MEHDTTLDKVNYPSDVKLLSFAELDTLCAEIREFLIENVSKTGGHLASNLGVVEITVGIHRVFNCPVDNIIFDVGHQSYVHKILTGRKDRFDTLRMLDGMSGFQRPSESPYDCFVTGHASNSISAALGMARARTLAGRHNEVLCVIGDGALTGGMAYEALNDAGQSGEKMIVVFNDNEMSISKNVGAVAKRLSHMRSRPTYLRLKNRVKAFLSYFKNGQEIIDTISKIKARLRKAILKESLFELLGFRYLGPVDGNDIDSVCALLEEAKAYNGPVVVHFKTIKGRGYHPSEVSPWDYHGVSPFDMVTGKKDCASDTFSDVFGKIMCDLAEEDDRICAVTAAMEDGTGLSSFSARYPSRFFDVGIAEGHAVSMASGMASQGAKPVFAVYSSFLQRGYDQLIHDVAIAKNHVVFAVDRAGLVGADGETHQGTFDVAYLLSVPGVKIFSPSSYAELESAMKQAIYFENGPVAVRFPRGGQLEYMDNSFRSSCHILHEGKDVTIAGYGIMINHILEASRLLEKAGISAEVVKINELSSFNTDMLFTSIRKTGALIVAEDCVSGGCLGEKIASELLICGVAPKLGLVNLGDRFIPHGKVEELWSRFGIDAEAIASKAKEITR
ncbi:MAG: 1-deoxy-D-xylulose-5-phosphate synthase [Clostridiaceae bacterium]|nr:1-deoxy-D-xylulose-5-phosphate synthase [Clostridiaceae bacterium]